MTTGYSSCEPQQSQVAQEKIKIKKEQSYRIVLSRLNSDAKELLRQFAESSRLELPSLPPMRLVEKAI